MPSAHLAPLQLKPQEEQRLEVRRRRRLAEILLRLWAAQLPLRPLFRQQLRLPHRLSASAWEDWAAPGLPLQAALQRTTCSASSLVEAAVRLLRPLRLPQQQRRARTLRWRRLAAASRCHPLSPHPRSHWLQLLQQHQLRLLPRRHLPLAGMQERMELQLQIRLTPSTRRQRLCLQLQPAQPRPQEPCPHRMATAMVVVVAIHLQRWEAVEAEAPLLHPAPRLHRRVLRRRIHLQLWMPPPLRHPQATMPSRAPAAALQLQVRLRLAQLRLADALQMTRLLCWTT